MDKQGVIILVLKQAVTRHRLQFCPWENTGEPYYIIANCDAPKIRRVVPEIASREHCLHIRNVVQQALDEPELISRTSRR